MLPVLLGSGADRPEAIVSEGMTGQRPSGSPALIMPLLQLREAASDEPRPLPTTGR